MAGQRPQLAEELLRRLAASLRAGQLYSRDHPIIVRNLEGLARAVEQLHAHSRSVVVGIVGDEFIVDDVPAPKADALVALARRLHQVGVERVEFERGVTLEEIRTLADFVATATDEQSPPLQELRHIRVGRVLIAERMQTKAADMATFRRMYTEAVESAEAVWESARTEGQPDVGVAHTTIDGLAEAVSQNRTALMALTALREYDNYTFTHMVNVSILTMGQARGLGVEGGLLREFGLAALMHDIGKVQTPLDILNKAEALTPPEFEIMKRHTIDGGEILRATPDVPPLAPIVAFEHHLRLDGTGYPEAAARPSLNLGTMLCSIADVYDAMRSQRTYQQAFPTDRILAVLRRNDGQQFDQHLVRRFAQLVGIYPAGNLVRLTTGEVAVVVSVYAPDTRRPRVRIVRNRHGERVSPPIDLNLWEMTGQGDLAPAIVAPLDPADVGIDPLSLI
jgi:HD-GYP domain-containing protein (c-di-GMP phosphodiesterase class II)